jgi:hypothetical protein
VTFSATISSINLQLLLAQPQINSLFAVGNQKTQAFGDDGPPLFPDAFGDVTQNLSKDDSDEEVPVTLLDPDSHGAKANL